MFPVLKIVRVSKNYFQIWKMFGSSKKTSTLSIFGRFQKNVPILKKCFLFLEYLFFFKFMKFLFEIQSFQICIKNSIWFPFIYFRKLLWSCALFSNLNYQIVSLNFLNFLPNFVTFLNKYWELLWKQFEIFSISWNKFLNFMIFITNIVNFSKNIVNSFLNVIFFQTHEIFLNSWFFSNSWAFYKFMHFLKVMNFPFPIRELFPNWQFFQISEDV